MHHEDPYIGKVVEGYRIDKFICRGGMGIVYEGTDIALSRTVAIKILPEGAVDNEELVRRFEREAKIIGELNHPNVAQVYRIGRIDGTPFYAMEYISGQSLADMLMKKGHIGGTKCVDYMIQAARGLQVAAQHNIIHRDVKPANIMVTEDDVIKIVDFGIAKVCRDDTFKTMTGMVVGTPRYMSPEQGRGEQVDLRADIYSLGATFFHLVTGKPPFDAQSPLTLIMKHMEEPVRSILKINPNVPDKLCNVIYAMMEKHPADRIQDYNQLLVVLQNIYDHKEGLSSYVFVSDDRDAEKETSGINKQLALWAMVVVVAIALLLTVPMLFSRSDSNKQPVEESATSANLPPEIEEEHKKPDRAFKTLRDLQKFQDEVRPDDTKK